MWRDLPLSHRVSGARQGYRTAYDVAAQLSGRIYLIAVVVDLAPAEARPGVSRLRYGFHVPGRDAQGTQSRAQTCWVELDNHALRASVRTVTEWTRQQIAASMGHGMAFPPEPLEMDRVETDVDEVLGFAFAQAPAAARRSEMTLSSAEEGPVWRLEYDDGAGFRSLRMDAATGAVLADERRAAAGGGAG